VISETERLQMLNDVSRALTSRLQLHDVYDTVYERISRIMDTSMFFLAFRLPNENQAYIAYLREFGKLSLDVTTPPGRSVTTHVMKLGQPLLFHSSEQYDRYAVSHGLPVIVLGDASNGDGNSMIFAPLNTGTETIGTLSVQSPREQAYSQHDFDTLTVIAAQAAIAVQNARLYEASRRSAQRHQALLKVAETINSSLQLSSVLNAVLDGIREVLPYHLAAIMMPDERTGRLNAVGSVGELSEERARSLRVPLGQGVTGKVLETGRPLIIQDVTKYEGYIPGSEETLSEAAVPLRRGDSVVGVLNVERSELNGFEDEDVELLMLFATQAAIAIENARLFEDQQNRVRQMQTIQNIVRDMTTVHGNDEMALAIERGLHDLIDFDECIIYLVNSSTPDGEPRLDPIEVSEHLDGSPRVAMVPRLSRVRGESVAGWVWQHEKGTVFESLATDPRSDVRTKSFGDFCVMGVPLMHNGNVSGVITIGKLQPGYYDESALNVLEIVAGHAAIGFDRCRLYGELHMQATTDDLTGLFNRRPVARRLREEMSRAARNGHSLAAILLDADDFKSINDTYGHDAGDEVLRGLAGLLQREVRTEDIVARYGGEEFLLLLPEVDAAGAVRVAERLRRLVASTELAKSAGSSRITVSVGVALIEPGDESEKLVSRADQAMYESKKKGGNRLCLAHNGRFDLLDPGSEQIQLDAA
jgi:diguanylate cyclase (GGDEF)-like protein